MNWVWSDQWLRGLMQVVVLLFVAGAIPLLSGRLRLRRLAILAYGLLCLVVLIRVAAWVLGQG